MNSIIINANNGDVQTEDLSIDPAEIWVTVAENAKHGRDEVQISSFGRDYQIAKQAVAEAADIREDKVAELKTKVNSGNYSVDTADFAKKLLEKYNTSLM